MASLLKKWTAVREMNCRLNIDIKLKIQNKSEPIPNRDKVRIIMVWCRWWDSNPHALADNGF